MRSIVNGLCALVAISALGLAACAGSSFPEAYRGGPEPVTLKEKPFNGFVQDEEKTARWLASDFLGSPDKLLSNPPEAFQTFSQLEWTSNELRRTYVLMPPPALQRLLEARDTIRLALNVPANQAVSDAITGYAQRGRTVSDVDRSLFTERRDLLRGAMGNAGYALKAYNDAVERQQWDYRQD